MEKVSCLMVTLDRYDHFVASYRCYCSQTYENKELVIVTDGAPEYQQQLQRHIDQSGRSDVRLITLRERLPLGALRNISLDAAEGDLVCQWDDDDLYHATRLAVQLDDMVRKGADVSYLAEQLQLFSSEKRMYWCDWTKSRDPLSRVIPGTLLARKKSLPRYQPEMRSSEDAVLRDQLLAAGVRMTTLSGKGHLYIYTFHGKNTFGRSHHDGIPIWAGLTGNELRERAAVIESTIGDYHLPPPISIVDKYANEIFLWDGTKLLPRRVSLLGHIRSLYRRGIGVAVTIRTLWHMRQSRQAEGGRHQA